MAAFFSFQKIEKEKKKEKRKLHPLLLTY